MGNFLPSFKNPTNEGNFCLSIGNDIWTEVFFLLDITSLVKTSKVCKYFAEICRNPKLRDYFKKKFLKSFKTEDKYDTRLILEKGIFKELSPEQVIQIKKNMIITPEPKKEERKDPYYLKNPNDPPPINEWRLKCVFEHDQLAHDIHNNMFPNNIESICIRARKDILITLHDNPDSRDFNTYRYYRTMHIVFRFICMSTYSHFDDEDFRYQMNYYSLICRNAGLKTQVCFIFYDFDNSQGLHKGSLYKLKKEITKSKGLFTVFEVIPKCDREELPHLIYKKISVITRKLFNFFSLENSPELVKTYYLLSDDFDLTELQDQAKHYLAPKNFKKSK